MGNGPRTLLAVVLLAASVLPNPAAAHEEYIVEEEHGVGVAEFVVEAADPFVIGPIAVGGLAAVTAVVGYLRFRPAAGDISVFRTVMREYDLFVPWLLRISAGIGLIGAGFGGYFVSPAVEIELRILQVGLGFLLLFGLATRAVALVTLAAYLVVAAYDQAIVLQLEYVGGLLGIALVGSGRPSADHVLYRVASEPGTIYGRMDHVHEFADAYRHRIRSYERYAPTVVRIGLGITFLYLGVGQKLLRPGIALAVVDHYNLTGVVPVPAELWVLGAGLTEATLGLLLIVGAFTRGVSLVALAVFVLTLFALPDDPVLAHVLLFGMASVLLITGAGPYAVDNRLRDSEEDERWP